MTMTMRKETKNNMPSEEALLALCEPMRAMPPFNKMKWSEQTSAIMGMLKDLPHIQALTDSDFDLDLDEPN